MTLATLEADESATAERNEHDDRWMRSRQYDPQFTATVVEAIRALRLLGPSWDSYGSPPIREEVIDAAAEFVSYFEPHAITRPYVVPLPTGGLQLEWHDGARVLEIEFEHPGDVHYLKWDPEAGVRDEQIVPSDAVLANQLARWFMQVIA
jgi:hypothetical protein